MKRIWKLSAGRSLSLIVLLGLPSAKADVIYDFSVNLSSGSAPGTVTGKIDLPFVSLDGSGSGAASSLVLTSFPMGIGTLSSNTVTSWAHQLADAFTVTSGAVTSYYFAADTSGDPSADFFQMNNTSNTRTDGVWTILANEAALDHTVFNFAYAFSPVVTFTPATVVPEPSSLPLLAGCLFSLFAMALRRKRA
jgi:hypothetical protein